MTQIGLGGEKGKNEDNAQLILSRPYVIQPHLKQKKKPSAVLMIIAILLTLCVIVTTILGIVWLVRTHIWLSKLTPPTTPEPPRPRGGGKTLRAQDFAATQTMTFNDIWTLRPKSFSGQWLREDGSNIMLYRDDYGNLRMQDFDTDEDRIIVNNMTFIENNVTRYYPNYDGSHILMIYDEEKVWRHSFQSRAFILQVEEGNRIEFPNNTALRVDRIQYANWAPRSNGLVFVQGNNIYYQDGPMGTSIQITTDGDELYLFNGIPDWLYEEDVLGSAVASYFSEDGRFLVFGKFDDTGVGLVEYPLYLPTDSAYSRQYKAAYPMAGNVKENGEPGENSKATLHVVDTQQGTTLTIRNVMPPSQYENIDHYFTRMAFVTNNTIAVTWTNRVQTEAIVQIYTLESVNNNGPTVTNKTHFHLDVENGWVDSPWPAPVPDLGDDEDLGYFTYFMNTATSGSYKNLARINISESGEDSIVFITESEHEVLGVIAYDEAEDYLYYYSTNGTQRNRHLMRAQLGGEESDLCITCLLPDCTYASAQFSVTTDYFLLSCLGPDIPRYEVMRRNLTVRDIKEDNAEFRQTIGSYILPEREFLDLDDGNGSTWSAEVFHPPEEGDGSMHPLLVYVYAGPGSLQVTSRYEYGSTISNWLRFMGSRYNIAVASVDARGTMGRGEDWKFQLYQKLATIEIDDQIHAANILKGRFNYLNADETAVFGWSYGGFAASHMLGKENQTTFQCGVAVAPVSSKRYYDTAYTERYMGLATADDNKDGYDLTDLFPLAANFRGKSYFIAHGTHDDNVHFRHFTNFVWSLVEEEVMFTQNIYVDQDHSINAEHQSRHLFHSMVHFLNHDCFTEGHIQPTLPPTEPPTTLDAARPVSSALTILTVTLLVLYNAVF